MAAIMYLVGIAMVLAGVVLGILGIKNPSQMQINGFTMESAVLLLVGGILSIGIGALLQALKTGIVAHPAVADAHDAVAHVPMQLPKAEVAPVAVPEPTPEPAPAAIEDTPSRIRFNPFNRKATDVAAGAAVGAATTAVAAAAEPAITNTKSAVDDTIAALEQAKADISNAVGGIGAVAETKVEEIVEDVATDEIAEDMPAEDVAEDDLYVLEEREIRGLPARILSDNTVEAETAEGWMRFENIEHLNEYLDALGEDA